MKWARETAGASVSDVARRLSQSESVVQSWEEGELDPPLGQLREVASFYHRPLSALLLSEPPASVALPLDFRTAARQAGLSLSQATSFAMRRARRAQTIASDIGPDADVVPLGGLNGVLGHPHHGQDALANLLCLCPNDHVLFDFGGITILPESLTVTGEREREGRPITLLAAHRLDPLNLDYHREAIFVPSTERTDR